MLPPTTVNCWNEPFQVEVVPPEIVPPVELTQLPLVNRVAHDAVVASTMVPSGTVLPAESLIPLKVTVPVPPALIESVVGPLATAEVAPCRFTAPLPIAVTVSTFVPVLSRG